MIVDKHSFDNNAEVLNWTRWCLRGILNGLRTRIRTWRATLVSIERWTVKYSEGAQQEYE